MCVCMYVCVCRMSLLPPLMLKKTTILKSLIYGQLLYGVEVTGRTQTALTQIQKLAARATDVKASLRNAAVHVLTIGTQLHLAV